MVEALSRGNGYVFLSFLYLISFALKVPRTPGVL